MIWHSLGEAALPVEMGWLSPVETERMRTMRFTKRRTEWLLSRWTAKQALAGVLGLPGDPASLARIEIRSITGGGEHGAPEAFVDGSRTQRRISLTDRAGWSVCAIGDEAEAIGCDLELVEARSESFVADYFTASERKLVAEPPFEASPHLITNLIWSAKESALKALRSGLRRDTRSVEVAVLPAIWSHGWRQLATRSEERAQFFGWWRQYGAFLLTVVAPIESPPPRPLHEPPGLAGAEPTHSWMATPVAKDDPRSMP
jgi:4'-phosphopantetheinyl transferase